MALRTSHLIPLRLDNCELPLPFAELHTLDIQNWDGRVDDHLLVGLFKSIEKASGRASTEIRETKEIYSILDFPKEEAEYWKTISQNSNQDIEEYELYMKKFGKEAIFYDLAALRMVAIKKRKRPSIAKIIAGTTAILTLIILLSQVYNIFSSEKRNGKPNIDIQKNNIVKELVPSELGTIIIDQTYKPSDFLKADKVVITANAPVMKVGSLLIANEVLFSNEAKLLGDRMTIVALRIKHGIISASGLRDTKHGGDLFVVARTIEDTIIESSGIDGVNGVKGADGSNGAPGANGRNGKCDGFGGYVSAQPGDNGGNGGDGADGQDGKNGSNAGNIVLLVESQPSVLPVSKGGKGGKGGEGGRAGTGGIGGRGGNGCVGLGGSQPAKPNGNPGMDGKAGHKGADGTDGIAHMPLIRRVDFDIVIRIVQTNKDRDSIVNELRKL